MKVLCFGEIMLRLSPPHQQRFGQTDLLEALYGGSEANVAVSLAQLGLPAGFVTRVPDNALGRAALGSVARFGVSTDACVLAGERLGIYFLETGAGLRGSKILYDRQYSAMATLAPGMLDWHKILEGVSWVHWSGITPALSQSAADAVLEMLQVAGEMGRNTTGAQRPIIVSCDLNYRESCLPSSK
jgi:2-dehydro-3-deoxygluconokinase